MSDLSQESPLWREWAESRHSVQQIREELERLRAENARLLGDHTTALRLVADVRAAIGDDGKRMQPELIEYCRKLLLFARIRFGYAPGDYQQICGKCDVSHIADKRAAVCPKCADAAIDAAMVVGNG